jgi:uncharacterized protein with HEPN domain
MYHRSLYDILMGCGQQVRTLTGPMEDEHELFASAATLRAVEAQLLIMAHTLGNVTPMLHQRLRDVDWNGWHALHEKLRAGIQPRREETWYAVNGLVPQTMHLLATVRKQHPDWFEIDYG